MSNNDYILDAVKGEPNSLTSIAFNTGVIAERQRIIKLLEDQIGEDNCDGPDWHGHIHDCLCDLIALIKGENK